MLVAAQSAHAYNVGVQDVDVPLRLDYPRFESATKALRHILSEHVAREEPQPCQQGSPGVLRPQEAPGFLFRGECGLYPTTTASLARARGPRSGLQWPFMEKPKRQEQAGRAALRWLGRFMPK